MTVLIVSVQQSLRSCTRVFKTDTVDDESTIILVHDSGKAEILPGNSADSILTSC